MLRYAGIQADCAVGGIRRLMHYSLVRPAPLATSINDQINTALPPFVLPEDHDKINRGSHFLGGAVDLMAVPKKKVSPHKRGTRNGPKSLKPVPVIIKCKVCWDQPKPSRKLTITNCPYVHKRF